ncbi:MAG TPA: LPXTG cell wall anchor domain-containing protein [Ilumatobacteraceae bacterium]
MTAPFAVPAPRRSVRISAMALLAVGAVLVVLGILQTTTSHVTGTGCPSGTTLLAKFEYEHHRYNFVGPSGNQGIVSISHADEDGGDAHSSVPIKAVVVKGGTHSKIVWYTPAQTNLHFSNSGLSVGHGNTPDISNVQFCKVVPPPVTTPTEPPVTEPPVTEPPVTEPPVTEPPVTQPPVTEPPVTQPPVTQPPVTQPATTPPQNTQPSDSSSSTSTSVEQEPVIVTSTSIVTQGSTQSLPHTGAPSAALIALGLTLVASGGTLLVISRARTRRADS